jgi:hypothetical protein
LISSTWRLNPSQGGWLGLPSVSRKRENDCFFPPGWPCKDLLCPVFLKGSAGLGLPGRHERGERGTIAQIIQGLGGMTKRLPVLTYGGPTRIFAPTGRTFERPSTQREGALFLLVRRGRLRRRMSLAPDGEQSRLTTPLAGFAGRVLLPQDERSASQSTRSL